MCPIESQPPPARALETQQTGTRDLATAGAAATAVWCVHDLIVAYTSGQPELALGFLLPSLVLALGGALIGLALGALGRGIPMLWMMALAGLVLGASIVLKIPLGNAHLQLLRAASALVLATLVASQLARRMGFGQLRSGLALGAAAAVAMASLQPEVRLEKRSLLVLAVACALALLGRLRSPLQRTLSTFLLLIAACIPIHLQAMRRNQLARAPLPAPEGEFDSTGPDFLLVILDTVRADRLAPYGHTRQTTPLLDAYVENGFERYAWARSTSSWTLPSHASLFTGLMPSEHGATHPRMRSEEGSEHAGEAQALALREDVPTLAEILGQRGYRTGAVMANHGYLGSTYGLNRGYQDYDARPGGSFGDYLPLVQLTLLPDRAGRQSYRDATSITDRALDWLARTPEDRPRFLTLNYLDAHTPFKPAAPHDRAFEDREIKDLFGDNALWGNGNLSTEDRLLAYDRCLHYLDAELARLLDAVDLDKTVVIITSDHGEALGDHGFLRHGWTLYDSLTRVPLYVHPVGRAAVALRDEPIGGAEVFDLALVELGLKASRETDPTRPIAELFQTRIIPKMILELGKQVDRDLLCWTEGSRKWTVSSKGSVTAFDVLKDPGETEALELSELEIEAARMRAMDWWAANPPVAQKAAQISADEIDRLKDLGYMGGDEEE